MWGISSPANAQPARRAGGHSRRRGHSRTQARHQVLDFVGRVEAIQRVEVKARITGYLENIAFKEGDLIKEGAPLYSIEKGLFEAAVGQAEGALDEGQGRKDT